MYILWVCSSVLFLSVGPWYIVMQRQLRWLGHVMHSQSSSPSCTIRRASLGITITGRSEEAVSDHIKATLKKCHIPADELETLAEDRSTWRDTCKADRCFHDRVQPGCRRSPYSQTRNCRHNSKRSVLSHLQQSVRV